MVNQGLQDGGDPDITQQHPQKCAHGRVNMGDMQWGWFSA